MDLGETVGKFLFSATFPNTHVVERVASQFHRLMGRVKGPVHLELQRYMQAIHVDCGLD